MMNVYTIYFFPAVKEKPDCFTGVIIYCETFFDRIKERWFLLYFVCRNLYLFLQKMF